MAKNKVLKNDKNIGFELVALYGGVLALQGRRQKKLMTEAMSMEDL